MVQVSTKAKDKHKVVIFHAIMVTLNGYTPKNIDSSGFIPLCSYSRIYSKQWIKQLLNSVLGKEVVLYAPFNNGIAHCLAAFLCLPIFLMLH